MKFRFAIFLFVPFVSCKTASTENNTKAFNENSMLGSVDRIYMVYDDKGIVGTENFNKAFATGKSELLYMFSPDINTKDFYKFIFAERFEDNLRADDSLPYHVEAIACFNEPKEDDFCAPLPIKDHRVVSEATVGVMGGKTAEIISRRTDYHAKSAACTYKDPVTQRITLGMKANQRFRKADFGLLQNDLTKIVNLGDQQRTGTCVPLFGSNTIYENLSTFNTKISNYKITTAEKVQASISGGSCAIQAFGWAGKGLQKIGVLSSSNKVVNVGSKLIGNIQVSLLEHVSGIVTKLGNTTLGQTLVSKVLMKFGTSAASGLVLTPQISKLINQYYGNTITDEKLNQMTLVEASRIAKEQIEKISMTHAGKQVVAAVDALESSQLVEEAEQSAIKYLANKGLTSDQIAYSTLTISTFFVPGISCILAAKDISDILAKKDIQNNMRNFQKVANITKDETLKTLLSLGGEPFKNMKKIFEIESEKNSPLYFKNQLPRLIKDSPKDSEQANRYQASEFYLRVFNFYFAKTFNSMKFDETFSHGTIFGTTKAFEEFLKVWSELEVESKKILEVILDQRLLIASTVKLSEDFLSAINEEGRSEQEAFEEAEETYKRLFENM